MILTHHGINSFRAGGVTPTGTVEIGGKQYSTVQIGNQIWMSENLDWQFNGSDYLNPSSYQYRENRNTAYYSYYSSDSYSQYVPAGGDAPPKPGYGLLYNLTAMNYLNDNASTLFPDGWRIPASSDFETLIATAGGDTTAAQHLKSTTDWVRDANGDDIYGFNGVPSGYRMSLGSGSTVPPYSSIYNYALFWTSSPGTQTYYACVMRLVWETTIPAQVLDNESNTKSYAIRLVKDA